MSSAVELSNRIAKICHDYERESVVDATANILRYAIVQSHSELNQAEEYLDSITQGMKQIMRAKHYGTDGKRGVQRIIIPTFEQLLRSGA